MAQAPDVSEMRTEIRDFREHNTRVLNAMRADLNDLRTNVNDLRRHVDDGFLEIRGRLDAAAAGQEQIVALLNTLIDSQ